MLSCNSLQEFQTIYFVIYREITFWVKSLKSTNQTNIFDCTHTARLLSSHCSPSVSP